MSHIGLEVRTDGCGADCSLIEIRPARIEDLSGIVSVVEGCAPYLTAHIPYVYWMQIRQCRDLCAVAVLDGEIVGWRSVMQGSQGTYFIHQLGVSPEARRHGVARSLLAHLVAELKERSARLAIEFTIDRRNTAALDLVKAVAEQTGMHISKTAEPVHLLDERCCEDLYAMTAACGYTQIFSNEVPNALWTTKERTETVTTSASKRLGKRSGRYGPRSQRKRSSVRSANSANSNASKASSAAPCSHARRTMPSLPVT